MMTDTVNVPRERVERFKDALINMPDVSVRLNNGQKFNAYDLDDDGIRRAVCIGSISSRPLSLVTAPPDVSDLIEAALKLASSVLAAAPKADGMDAYTRPDTMREILDRQLADKSRRLNPEAPKVEQEPVAKVVSAHGDPEAFGEREIEALKDLSGIPYDTPLYTAPAPASDELPSSILEIAAERRRQVDVEGYSHKSDDDYELGELGLAAALYALPYEAERGGEKLLSQEDYIGLHIAMDVSSGWHIKPEPDRRRRMVKAGALIAAEIERLDRLAKHKGPQS